MAFKVDINGNVQYANREAGIKAHAEEYSFNIDSELFPQLTPEQQKLWRKEIEQAVISGGHCGLELAKDKRYDEESVSEKKCMYSKDNYTDEDRKVLCDGCKEECKYVPPVFDEGYWERLGEESVNKDLKEAAEEWDGSLYRSDAFIAGANWQKQKDESYTKSMYKVGISVGKELMKQQLMANAVNGFVIEDIEEGNGDFLLSAEYLSKDMGLKDRQKVKVIVIKED